MTRKAILFTLSLLMGMAMFSCKEYIDDIQGIGKRVVALEDSSLKFNDFNKAMETLRYLAKEHGFISSIEEGDNGTYTLHLKGTFNGVDSVLTDSVIVLKSGVAGEDGAPLSDFLTVRKEGDTYYWVFNGNWLLDADGNKIPTAGQDGKPGKDADPTEGEIIMPQMRINEYGFWEISNDGGNTWTTTDVNANGKDGKTDPLILGITEEEEDIIITIFYNGKVTNLTIPKLKK